MRGPGARARLIGALAVCLAVALCRAWPPVLTGLALGLISLALGEREWGRLARRLALVNVFFLGILATVPLAVPGEALFTIGPLAFTRQGLAQALIMTAKGNAIFLVFWGLIRPISPPRLGAALATLGVPDKLCLILALTYRYLDLMRHEWARLTEAARLRGFTPGLNSRALSTFALMLALLFTRALDRASAIHQAMVCRGFDGRFKSLGERLWQKTDTALVTASLAAAILVVTLERA